MEVLYLYTIDSFSNGLRWDLWSEGYILTVFA